MLRWTTPETVVGISRLANLNLGDIPYPLASNGQYGIDGFTGASVVTAAVEFSATPSSQPGRQFIELYDWAARQVLGRFPAYGEDRIAATAVVTAGVVLGINAYASRNTSCVARVKIVQL